jgi:chromate reductase, NAD(P)H dehydrogenase (quinone)
VLVLGLCGSLRRDSYNRRLLRATAAQFPPGVVFEEWTQLAWVPAYNEDLDGESAPPPAVALRRALAAADAVLIATPEYNASLPGQLKNALDWASRPFPDNALRGKPVAVIGASTSLFGAVWAQAELRKVLKAIGAEVIEDELPVAQVEATFAQDGNLRDPELQARLAHIVRALLGALGVPAEAA